MRLTHSVIRMQRPAMLDDACDPRPIRAFNAYSRPLILIAKATGADECRDGEEIVNRD
jgi:hypothetical protein